jgi:hypothetical protein
MKSVSLLWQKVQRPVLLAFVFIYLLTAWTSLYWIYKGVLILVR